MAQWIPHSFGASVSLRGEMDEPMKVWGGSALNLIVDVDKQVANGYPFHVRVGLKNVSGGFGLAIELHVRLAGVEREVAEKLVERAHRVCPYSNATRGNVDVALTIEELAAAPA